MKMVDSIKSSVYFTGQGWGMIRASPPAVYRECQASNKSFVVIRDYVPLTDQTRDLLDRHFARILEMRPGMEMLGAGNYEPGMEHQHLVLDAQSVYRYFLRVHEVAVSRPGRATGTSGNILTNTSKLDYRFTEIIFIELTTHLNHTVEYLLLLFKYLLHQGLRMSQLFVICDYPTSAFDFIETEIMEVPVTYWSPTVLQDRAPDRRWFENELSDSEKLKVSSISDIQLEIYRYGNVETFKEQMGSKKLCIVISSNNFYENHLSSQLSEVKHTLYEDVNSFLRTPQRSEYTNILLLKSAEELFAAFERAKLDPVAIIFDTRFKAGVNMLYSGNVLMPVRPNQDYVRSVVWKLLRKDLKASLQESPKADPKIFVYDEGKEPAIRSVFLRSPIIDYMQMRMFKVDMLLLYTNYYKGTSMRNFLSVVRAEASVLRSLHFEDEYAKPSDGSGTSSAFVKCVQLNIHPLVISMIENWCKRTVPAGTGNETTPRRLPRIAILVFAAVMLTADNQVVEIKEHGTREHENDVSQTSFYGQALFRYLRLMETHRSAVMEEGGKTARLLKRLLDAYQVKEDEMLLFDHNTFTQHLVKMILEDYRPFVLTQHNQTIYHGTYNTQMNWRVRQTTNLPQHLLPFAVSMGATNKRISLFVPLSRA